jgi:hypothetical protein
MGKWFIALAVAALMPIAALAVGPQPAPLSPPVEVTFGYQKVGHLAPIVMLADELKPLGINLKLVEFVRYADARTASGFAGLRHRRPSRSRDRALSGLEKIAHTK